MKNPVLKEMVQPETEMAIPYVNIRAQHVSIKEDLLVAIAKVMDHGQFILGPEVAVFENRFAELCGVRFAVAVNSGTDALVLALKALQIGADDEVITAPNSFISSTSCIHLVGAQPIFVDVGDDYNMDPIQIERAITSRTKAILPVHLTGRPARMDQIMRIAEKHHLAVVEDAAQAVLAQYQGKSVGSFGIMGCFSLHPLKTLNACGDGGVVTTNDENLYSHLKVLRNLGLENRDQCMEWSGNSRLDSIQAACLLVKLDHVNCWTEKRREHARFYERNLSHLQDVKCPKEQSFEKSVYHTFVINVEHRDELKQYLADHGIETAIHYPIPIHLQPVSSKLEYKPGSFPVAERLAKRILSLPIYPELTPEALEYVVNHIQKFYKNR